MLAHLGKFLCQDEHVLVVILMAPKFEIYTDKAGKCRWRLKAANGEVIATSEAYESQASCKNGIASVKKNAPIAEVVMVD